MTSDAFESPKLLIEEARENLKDLHSRCKAFLDSNPYTEIQEIDRETGDKLYKLRLTTKPPGRLRTRTSSIVNDLRHALDQAVVASAKQLGITRFDRIYFPFAASPRDLQDIFRKTGRCKDVPVEIRPLLCTFEPYPRSDGHKGGDDLLRALGTISGPNKHQVILAIGLNIAGVRIHRLEGQFVTGVLGWDDTKGDLTIARCRADGDVKYNLTVPFYVAFGDIPIIGRQELLPILNHLGRKVESIVMAIEVETARLLTSHPIQT